jgi:hypothetical protein
MTYGWRFSSASRAAAAERHLAGAKRGLRIHVAWLLT